MKVDKKHKHVVNWVTNGLNNESFQDALYNEVWSKIGTEGETYVLLDNNATLVAGGGLNESKDEYLESYNLEGSYGIVRYLSKK